MTSNKATIRETSTATLSQQSPNRSSHPTETTNTSTEMKTDKLFEKHKLDCIFTSDWPAHVEAFNDLCDNVRARKEDKPRLRKLTLEKEARTFYHAKISGNNFDWPTIEETFHKEYSDKSKRRVFSNKLKKKLRFDAVVKDSRTPKESLRVLCTKIHTQHTGKPAGKYWQSEIRGTPQCCTRWTVCHNSTMPGRWRLRICCLIEGSIPKHRRFARHR